MIVLILANGELHLSPELLQFTKDADYLIAADGGAEHCSALGRIPDTLIGDLDSVSENLLAEYKMRGVKIFRHPVRKNTTDLELAIDHAVYKGATEICFAGMLGGRWDMSLANIFLLAHERFEKIQMSLFGDECVMHILHPGKHSFTTPIKQRASLLPLKGDGEDITLTGFEYPLDHYTIPFGSSIGVSNITIETTVFTKHSKGVLLLILSSPLLSSPRE